MATTALNQTAYAVEADNLIIGATYPVLTRKLTIQNPEVALKRGMAVIAGIVTEEASDGGGGTVDVKSLDGKLYIAGAEGSNSDAIDGYICGILVADADADTTSTTIDAYAYVSGAFNIAAVTSLDDDSYDVADGVLGAQGYGIYLL